MKQSNNMEFKKWKFCLAYCCMNIMTNFELYFHTDRKDHKELQLQHGESIFNFHFRCKNRFRTTERESQQQEWLRNELSQLKEKLRQPHMQRKYLS